MAEDVAGETLQHRQDTLKTLVQRETAGDQNRRTNWSKTREDADPEFEKALREVIEHATPQDEGVNTTIDILEDQLVVERNIFKRFEHMRNIEIKRRQHPLFQHPNPQIFQIANSLKFEMGIALLMIGNGFTLAVGADKPATQTPAWVETAEIFFTLFFVGEAYVRITAFGWPWIFDFYNFIDLLLIFVTGVLVMFLDIIGFQSSFIRSFQVLRLLRMFKIIRAVKAIPALNLIWRMIRSFLASGKILFWAIVDFLFLNLLFAVFYVVLVGQDSSLIHDDVIADLFGNISRALFTTMQVATLAQWSRVVRAIQGKSSYVLPISVGCIVACNFVLLNIVTAVVIHQVFKSSKKDQEIEERQREQKRLKQWQQLRVIFSALDVDGSGKVTADELQEALNSNMILQRKLQDINMDKSEIAQLWQILDTSGDGVLEIDEFVEGCRHMKGAAKSYDMIRNTTRSKALFKRSKRMGEFIHALTPEAKRLNIEVDRLHRKMLDVLTQVRPIEKKVLSIVRLASEDMIYATDDYGMPLVREAVYGQSDNVKQ